LSYKKASSRPIDLNFEKQTALQIQFSIEFIKNLSNELELVNIDEASISNTTKLNYSWLRKGVDESIANIKFTKSISIISAITSSGTSFTAVINGTITSRLFLNYLEDLFDNLRVRKGEK
jgi:predicted PurR-regulated permease PerM